MRMIDDAKMGKFDLIVTREKKLYCIFTIPFKEALRYRNKKKQLLRQNQYKELKLYVYI